jgi:hypothetical protein
MEHECTMKDELTKAVEGIKTQNRWFMGIFGGAVILLLVGYGTLSNGYVTNKTNITKITNDYAPLIVVQDIMENNDRMISIMQIISNSAKDDPRYQEAIHARDKFQREALQRAATTKRGGGGGGIGGNQ